MFVVRLDRLEKQPSDFKAFVALPDARRRFWAGVGRVVDGDLEAAALFHVVDETNVRTAVEAVKSGNAVLIERWPSAAFHLDLDIEL